MVDIKDTMTVQDQITAQEILDTVARHMASQKCRSMDLLGASCLYRGPDGLKCNVGCLITDDEYSPDMEHNAVEDIPLPVRLQPHVDLLMDLQDAHDTYESPRPVRNELRRIAQENGLDPRLIDTITEWS